VSADDRLRIEVDQNGGTTVVKLHGELDLASASAFSAQLDQTTSNAPAAVVLDLTALEFIDSTGLRSILRIDESCRESGRRFAVVPGESQVARLFEIARVQEHLELISSAAELRD
jgi:anti-sigma B factor antagonist